MCNASIIILRHGETDANVEKRLVGQIDPPLNAKGIAQANDWKEKFRRTEIKQIFSSNLMRAASTAEAIAEPHSLNINFDSDLREASGGNWDGMKIDELNSTLEGALRNENPYEVRPPQGESYRDAEVRFMRFIRRLFIGGVSSNTIIVTHKGILRCCSHLFGKNLAKKAGLERFDHQDWVKIDLLGSEYIYNKIDNDITIEKCAGLYNKSFY